MKRKIMPPRNYVTVAMLKRKTGGGAHGKTAKAQRQQVKVELKLVCNSVGQNTGLLIREPSVRIRPHLPSTKGHSCRVRFG